MENKELKVTEYDRITEKPAREKNGWVMLIIGLLLVAGGFTMLILGIVLDFTALMPFGLVAMVVGAILLSGLRLLQPNEAYVLTLFGKYYGTLKRDGFYWVNPFCSSVNPARLAMGTSRKISLKAMTLNNDKQKVNDEEGNPIEISVVVIWRITNTARAVFNVENYMAYISTQCDAAIRQVARQYPYDVSSNGDEKSLRGSAQEIADVLREELQQPAWKFWKRASRTSPMRPKSRRRCSNANRPRPSSRRGRRSSRAPSPWCRWPSTSSRKRTSWSWTMSARRRWSPISSSYSAATAMPSPSSARVPSIKAKHLFNTSFSS